MIFAKIRMLEDAVPRVLLLLRHISNLSHTSILVRPCLPDVTMIRSPVAISISCMFPIWLLALAHLDYATSKEGLKAGSSSFSSQPFQLGHSVKEKKRVSGISERFVWGCFVRLYPPSEWDLKLDVLPQMRTLVFSFQTPQALKLVSEIRKIIFVETLIIKVQYYDKKNGGFLRKLVQGEERVRSKECPRLVNLLHTIPQRAL